MGSSVLGAKPRGWAQPTSSHAPPGNTWLGQDPPRVLSLLPGCCRTHPQPREQLLSGAPGARLPLDGVKTDSGNRAPAHASASSPELRASTQPGPSARRLPSFPPGPSSTPSPPPLETSPRHSLAEPRHGADRTNHQPRVGKGAVSGQEVGTPTLTASQETRLVPTQPRRSGREAPSHSSGQTLNPEIRQP